MDFQHSAQLNFLKWKFKGFFTQKNPCTLPKKFGKKFEKIQKIRKNLKKSEKFEKIQKKKRKIPQSPENPKKFKKKFIHHVWE